MPPSVIPLAAPRRPPANLADLASFGVEHAQAPLPAPLAPPDSDSEGETPPVVVAARQRRDVVLLIALVIAVPSVFLLVLAAGLIYHYASPRPRTKPARPPKAHASGSDTDFSDVDLGADPPPYDGSLKPPANANAAEKTRAPPKRVWYEKPGVVPYGAAVTVFPVSLDAATLSDEKEWEKSKAKEKEAEADAVAEAHKPDSPASPPRHLSSPLTLPPTLPASPAYTFRPDPPSEALEAHEPPQPPCACTEPTCPGGALAFASGPRRRHPHAADADEWSDSSSGDEVKTVVVKGPARTPSCACDEPSCPGGEIAAAGLRRRRRLGRPWWRRVFD
ncbi:uncharacterized protein LOC62_01G001068 [Vanrija pseudolonga]|uniref:Uncharacterized protein n=1 Tax=Vanrija pseudolonga TaxID=143232 RepID=A0AAF1BIR6_9TREE|nr:hypothetical protein LOC62_01G001068 [Vanrija pseudolonga]